MTVIAPEKACSGPARGAHVGSDPAILPGLRSAIVWAMSPPRDSPHTIVFLTPLIAPALMYFSRFSPDSTPSAVAQPCLA